MIWWLTTLTIPTEQMLVRLPFAVSKSKAIIAVHGIQPDDVQNAPDFAFVYPHMLDFIGNLPVVAHNAAFDMNVLHESIKATTGKLPIKSNICG